MWVAVEIPRIGYLNRITEDIILPKKTEEGNKISWVSSNPEIVSDAGKVTRPSYGEGRKKVTLTATVDFGTKIMRQGFEITVLPETSDEEYGYLFAYFTGNGDTQERLSYGLSKNGYDFYALNGTKPVFKAEGGTGHLRDPYIFKGENGIYYCLATDMNTYNGGQWSNQSTIFTWESTDLINWTNERIIDFKKFKGFESCDRAWAPQAIWCPEKKQYMIYLALKSSDGGTYMYRCYTDDFASCTPPEIMFDFKSDAIDGDILQNPVDNRYYMYFKYCRNGGVISVFTADELSGEWTDIDVDLPKENNMGVEGSAGYKLIGENRWNNLVDCFQNGRFMCLESTDMVNYNVLKYSEEQSQADYYLDMYDYGATPRHSSVITINKSEYERLEKKYGGSAIIGVKGKHIKGYNSIIDAEHKTIQLAVTPGHITEIEPEFLFENEGVVISPSGIQDFTKKVVYTVTNAEECSVIWTVSAVEWGNSVLGEFGLFGDPNIAIINSKYYIYPTTDGKCGWDSTYFKAFSSTDLVHWKDEGVILDLKDVSWSSGHHGWAPTIAERNGKYYFYYSSGNKINWHKDLAVAVADSPDGPFKDIGHPLVKGGKLIGEMIDPQVFIDTDGTPYLFWGNRRLYAAQLNEDMISFASDIKDVTPDNFTEGVFVIKRNDKYYFTWSQGDTRLASYLVRYGVSDSPFEKPKGSTVILSEKNTNDPRIMCTAHHSIVNVPGTDKWYISYHRFNIPTTVLAGEGIYAGSHREVAIDELTFDENGNINTVIATLEGVTEPVTFTM